LNLRGEISLAFSVFDEENRGEDLGLNSNKIAIPPPETVIATGQPYSYYRFSAFPNDRRVNPDGSYRKGSYATTYNDLHSVPSGFSAVGRYALPNPASAQYVFPILTLDRPSLMGTTTPNHGQAGGG
jgi:hypothetical protein